MELGKKDEEETANTLKIAAKAKINCGGQAPTETVGFLDCFLFLLSGALLCIWGVGVLTHLHPLCDQNYSYNDCCMTHH